ncbi:hypothetical protein ABFX02_04G123000 [Erythranthe guttata]
MNQLAFVFGLLGTPTFYTIFKKKSTQGFQSVPYVVGLFSAMLWIYYAFLKPETTLLITINTVGCFVQSTYICFYLFFASKNARIQTVKLILLLNVVGFGLIIVLTHFWANDSNRDDIRQVIRTKSVEYMPFLLSFFLTLSAVMWFFYGLLRKDYNIAIPNVLGFLFGVVQMVLYVMYKNTNPKKVVKEKKEISEIETKIIVIDHENKLPELKEQIIDVMKLGGAAVLGIIPLVPVHVDNQILGVGTQCINND